MAQAQATVVRAFGLGTGAWALWVDLDRNCAQIGYEPTSKQTSEYVGYSRRRNH